VDDVTLRTRGDGRTYMTALPEGRARRAQWQSVARLLLDGANAEAVTRALELALMYEARLDLRNAVDGHNRSLSSF
jgi:hypothetical protein